MRLRRAASTLELNPDVRESSTRELFRRGISFRVGALVGVELGQAGQFALSASELGEILVAEAAQTALGLVRVADLPRADDRVKPGAPGSDSWQDDGSEGALGGRADRSEGAASREVGRNPASDRCRRPIK
jgi:hypothetical protein